MQTPPTKDDFLNRLDTFLWEYFPDSPHEHEGPSWQQIPYRCELFDLCKEAHGILGQDHVAHHINYQWNIHRTHVLSLSDQQRLDLLVEAWDEWQYAIGRMRGVDYRVDGLAPEGTGQSTSLDNR